ncbi:MAG: GNAT family N-acetyltransferase [Myxococcales bacterium]|nr:GNAT family N-acetyltransferase [Myxococcales bacterium]
MTEIIVRAFEMADWEDVATLFLSEKCQWGTFQLPLQSRDDIRHKLANPPPLTHRLVAVQRETGRVVGMIGLHGNAHARRAHAAGIGMFVHEDFHNQGIGSKLLEEISRLAFRWLGLQRLELTVYVDNEPAIHLYKKNGFVLEGTFQRYAFRDGVFVDAHTMGKIRDF